MARRDVPGGIAKIDAPRQTKPCPLSSESDNVAPSRDVAGGSVGKLSQINATTLELKFGF